MLGLWADDDVSERGIFDDLIVRGQPSLVLAFVLVPARHFELLDVAVGTEKHNRPVADPRERPFAPAPSRR